MQVDQPVGTGYSYSKSNTYSHNQSDVTRDFIGFLDNFLLIFPQYQNSEVHPYI